MLFVAKIHNMELGRSQPVNNHEDGAKILLSWIENDQIMLSDEEIAQHKEALENGESVYIDADSDNQYTYTFGVMD